MVKKRKRRRYKTTGSSPLVTTPSKESKELDHKQLGLTVLSFVLGQTVGAAVGKTSGYLGSVITGVGVWKKNLYATSFGAGMTMSEANGASGFSLDSVKERTMGFVKIVGGKFLHPMGEQETTASETGTATNGLGEGEQQPKYFLNPYTQNNDFSQAMRDLEKVEAEVREVSGIEDDELDAGNNNY